MIATVDVLPEEVVAHILLYLSLPDRKSASLACRRWLNAARHPALMRDVVLDAGACLSDIASSAAASNSGSILPTEWKPLVRSLVLGSRSSSGSSSSAALNWRQLATTLDGCHRLVSVDLSGCDALCLAHDLFSDEAQRLALQQQLGGVKRLSLAGLSHLTANGLRRLTSLFTGLESICLSGCSLVCSNSVVMSSSVEGSVLTFSAVLDVVRQCQISELDLSGTDVTDAALELLSTVENLHLTGIRLDSCRLLEGRGLARLLTNQCASLERLSVAKNRHLQTPSMIPEHLTELSGAGSSNFISDRLLVASAPSLTVLDIADCNRISTGALTSALVAARHLRRLVLSRCTAVTDVGFSDALAADSLKSLEHLNVSSCAGFTDVGLRLVCGQLSATLKGLRLAWLRGITDWGLMGLPEPKAAKEVHGSIDVTLSSSKRIDGRKVEQFPHYKRAVDIGDPAYSPPSLAELRRHSERAADSAADGIGPRFSLANLRRLKLLDLSNCSKVTRVGLDELFQPNKFPFVDLEELHLQGNRHVTDSHLISLSSGAPSLRQLHLSGSAGITDSGLTVLASRCHRLRSLSLSNCDSLTDAGLSCLTMDSLRFLDLSYCARISQAGMDQLARWAPQIREVRGLWTGTELIG